MKLVVDTNVLYSYFWKISRTKDLIINPNLELFAPEFALEEINKYNEDIIKKAKITGSEFRLKRFDMAISVKFIPMEDYKNFLKNALVISPDSNDVDFLALALKLKIPIWSNDKELKKQWKIKVFSTKDILELFDFG